MAIFEGSENSLLLNVDGSEIKENFMVELWTNFATHHHNPTPVEIACLAYGVKGTFTSQKLVFELDADREKNVNSFEEISEKFLCLTVQVCSNILCSWQKAVPDFDIEMKLTRSI